MLHQISWFTYAVGIGTLAVLYYLFVGFTYFKAEFLLIFQRLTGKQPGLSSSNAGDLQLPDHSIMGAAQPENVEFVSAADLSFGPAGDLDAPAETGQVVPVNNSRLISHFSDMISEVKTLIRVINESSESKENFEMLFKLVIEKYPELTGSSYRTQINDYLLAEGAPEFPFSLTKTDLENYWNEEAQITAL